MKYLLTYMEKPCLFTGYPYYVYGLIDVFGVFKLVTCQGTTYLNSQFWRGVYQMRVPDTSLSFFEMTLKTNDDEPLTKTYQCISVQACKGVYLRWENDLGGYDYYLFSGNTRENFNSGTESTFIPYLDDIKEKTSNIEVLKKNYKGVKRCFATFSKENQEAFKQLARSRYVDMYVNTEWIKVDVEVNSFQVSERSTMGKNSNISEFAKNIC